LSTFDENTALHELENHAVLKDLLSQDAALEQKIQALARKLEAENFK
jgi:hypothetical protein